MGHSSVTNVVCQLRPTYGSCAGLPAFYRDHKGKPYCVLHLPSEDKNLDLFQQEVRNKLLSKKLNFAGVYFPSKANFRKDTFEEEANFSHAVFKEEADFREATFEGEANFRKAIFEKEANFRKAIFEEEANFRKATFKGSVEFAEPERKKPEDSSKYSFNKRANFSMANFEKQAVFVGPRTFNTQQVQTTFRDALIEKPEVFSLDRVQLRPSWFIDTNVREFRFTSVGWRGLLDGPPGSIKDEIEAIKERRIKARRDKKEDEDGDEDRQLIYSYPPDVLARAYRELAANAEENRDFPTANEFHYWSMEAGRKESWESKKEAWRKLRSRLSRIRRQLGSVAILPWTWRSLRRSLREARRKPRSRLSRIRRRLRRSLIPTLYWLLSGYGERPRRAFWILVAMWLAFAALYFLLANSAPFWVFSASDIWQGIDYARQAVVYSLSALARLNPEPKPEELGWFQTLVTVEGIIGPLQIGLLLLAVRRKVMR